MLDYDIYLDNPTDWSEQVPTDGSNVMGFRGIRSVATGDPDDLGDAPCGCAVCT